MPTGSHLDDDDRQQLAEEIKSVLREKSDPVLTVTEVHEEVDFDASETDVRERVEFLYQ